MHEMAMNGSFVDLLNSVGKPSPDQLPGCPAVGHVNHLTNFGTPELLVENLEASSNGLVRIEEGEISVFSDSTTKGSRCFSFFNQSETKSIDDDISSSLNVVKHAGSIEESLREFCTDRSKQLFKPTVGLEFESTDEAYQYYNMYSWVMGFSIRCGDAYVGKKGKLMMKEFCCQREGHAKNATHATMSKCLW